VIFGATVKHAVELAEAAQRAGYRAENIEGSISDAAREKLLRRIGLPQRDPMALDVITNCKLLTEGWDCPPVEVMIAARGFSTWGAWMQAIGRVLRPSPATGKTGALIEDLYGCVWDHGAPWNPREPRLDGLSVAPNGGAMALSSCLACGCVYQPGPPCCPRCGAARREPPPPRVQERPMGLVTGERIEQAQGRKRAAWDGLVRYAREQRYDNRWIIIQFNLRYERAYGRAPAPWIQELRNG
jgi:hypothetical protein